jgi:GT2 family glycosyltransferase
LHALSRWSEQKAEVIVVDNGSSQEDLSLLQNAQSQFQLVVNETNRGYAGGNNAGITRALDEGHPYIMLLNSDAAISDSCVKQLLACMKHSPDLGVVGPLLEEGGRIYAGEILGFIRGRESIRAQRWRFRIRASYSGLCAGSALLSPKAFERLACWMRSSFSAERSQTFA